MKKYIFFLSIFIFFGSAIFVNFHKFNADIFSLLDLNINSISKLAIKSQQEASKFDFSVLVKDRDDAKKIDILIKQSDLFDKNSVKKIDDLKLVLFDKRRIDEPKGIDFFQNSAKSLFDINRNFSINDDFFSMISLPKMANTKFDIETGFLKTQNFYLLNYKLNQDYDEEKLINLYKDIKKFKNTHINSSQIYNLYAKDTARNESLKLGLLSLGLTFLFMIFAFGDFRIFYILLIVIFSLICGLGLTLLIFDEVSFLSLVISTSLIGLIVDYAMHFLSANLEKNYKKEKILNFYKIFFVAFLITSSGYLLFFLSPMKFLHEIAFISVASLFFSSIFTYFIFPDILRNAKFKKSYIFNKIFHFYIKVISKIKIKVLLIYALILLIFISFLNVNLNDNIKNYIKLPQNLEQDSYIFSKELDLKSDFLLVDKFLSNTLVLELKEKKLIQNPFFITNFINDIKTQNDIKDYFKKHSLNPNIIKIYENLGFQKDEIDSKFKEIYDFKTMDLNNSLKILGMDIRNFFVSDKEIIKASSFVKNRDFDEILQKYNAVYVNFIFDINKNLNSIKIQAIFIKFAGLIVAFIALGVFLNFKLSLKIVSLILLSSILSVIVFVILGLNLDIFVLFGFILASAAGIDYMLFAINENLDKDERIFGIMAASFTSILSFFTLIFSSTTAVFSFGLGVSLNLFILMILSSILSIKSH
ncbi:hypothetical protein F1B92_06000 [Campylobacter sp. FMV-PI01]|uniref:MMPL family transporter n=1 Tax=Campylobacter portucalensis TaxID=2608384 RepID=A0A6L5WIF3_9BACT|nr:hypothetical protein [Campylobacter portucalensis]MSN96716.1 hypothetical protein [Campylobacter portucalensis]